MLNDLSRSVPPWFASHMGTTDLEEICPVVYQVLTERSSSSIYGTTTSKKLTSERQHESYKPILPHQIFAKMVSTYIYSIPHGCIKEFIILYYCV